MNVNEIQNNANAFDEYIVHANAMSVVKSYVNKEAIMAPFICNCELLFRIRKNVELTLKSERVSHFM